MHGEEGETQGSIIGHLGERWGSQPMTFPGHLII